MAIANSDGQPLPSGLRARFERAAGTHLGDVRVRVDSAVADAGARALGGGDEIRLAPGAECDGDAGAWLLAHEVAHLLQQRAGRVAVPAPGAIVDDAALEAEADALAAALLGGRLLPCAWLRHRVDIRGPRAWQPFRVIRNQDLAANGIALGNATFPGQMCGVANGAASDGSFLRADGSVNVVDQPHAQVSLRLGNTGELAIEDCNLDVRQARVFFATDERITTNNEALARAGSRFRIGKVEAAPGQPRALTVAANRLFQVQMVNASDGRAFSVAGNNCNEVAGMTMGVALDHMRTVRTWPRTPGAVARLWARLQQAVAGRLPAWLIDDAAAGRLALYVTTLAEGGDRDAAATAARNMQSDQQLAQGCTTPDQMMQALARHYDPLGQRYGLAQLAATPNYVSGCRNVGVNEWADPLVGDAYFTVSIAGLQRNAGQLSATNFAVRPSRSVTPCWEFHWGAVATKKGADRVVFENYARNGEDGAAQARTGEHRAFFEMYEVPSGGETGEAVLARSWHRTWRGTGFANPITLAVTRR